MRFPPIFDLLAASDARPLPPVSAHTLVVDHDAVPPRRVVSTLEVLARLSLERDRRERRPV